MHTPHLYDPLQARVIPHTNEILDACLVLWGITEAGYQVSLHPDFPIRVTPDQLEYYWMPENRKFTYSATHLWYRTQPTPCADMKEAREQLTEFCDLLEGENPEAVKKELQEACIDKQFELEKPWINNIYDSVLSTGHHRFYNTLPQLVALIERHKRITINRYTKAYLGRLLHIWAETGEEPEEARNQHSFTIKVHFSGTHIKYAIDIDDRRSPKARKRRRENAKEMQILMSVMNGTTGKPKPESINPESVYVDGKVPSWDKVTPQYR